MTLENDRSPARVRNGNGNAYWAQFFSVWVWIGQKKIYRLCARDADGSSDDHLDRRFVLGIARAGSLGDRSLTSFFGAPLILYLLTASI